MTSRSRRVLWLLQHRTLMQAEVPILRGLGYEVFVPKVFEPGPAHRSSAVSYEWDESLTIPSDVLDRLNGTDFYGSPLSATLLNDLNTYFGAAFFIFIEQMHISLFRGFRGALISRPFGLLAPDTYFRHLQTWDPSGVELVAALGDRYWFGSSYPTLADAEPPLLADRNVYLPIALPDSFAKANAETWTGGDARILFVCPDINSNAALRAIYEEFKRDYGHLDHLIVGKQHVPVDDPHVLGFVPDRQLLELMRSCALMVYTSHEPRHVHYHPVEAMVIGLPVVFYRQSLLGGLVDPAPFGAVDDVRAGQALAARLLSGEDDAIQDVRRSQRVLATRFSQQLCASIWAQHFERSGIARQIEAPPSATDLSTFDTDDPHQFVPPELLRVPGVHTGARSLIRGVDLRDTNLSPAIAGTHGLGDPQPWGRWVHGPRATFRFERPVSGSLEIELVGGTLPENRGLPIALSLGTATASLAFVASPDAPARTRVALHLHEPADVLVLEPSLTVRDAMGRDISLGIRSLRIRRRPVAAMRALRRLAEAVNWRIRRLARAFR